MSTIELNTTAQGKRKQHKNKQQQKPQQILVQEQEVFKKMGEKETESEKLAFFLFFLFFCLSEIKDQGLA